MKTVIFVVSIMIVLAICLLADTNAQSQQNAKELSLSGPSASRLIATDIEVSQFFNHYIERYTRKDMEGFLWLFSSRVLQNQSAELEDIRESYSNFFNESLDLQYGIEDRKVEIYENAVEVKARYKIEQIVKKVEKERSLEDASGGSSPEKMESSRSFPSIINMKRPLRAEGGS